MAPDRDCPVCLEAFPPPSAADPDSLTDPVALCSHHVLCRGCYERLLTATPPTHAVACPVCRRTVGRYRAASLTPYSPPAPAPVHSVDDDALAAALTAHDADRVRAALQRGARLFAISAHVRAWLASGDADPRIVRVLLLDGGYDPTDPAQTLRAALWDACHAAGAVYGVRPGQHGGSGGGRVRTPLGGVGG